MSAYVTIQVPTPLTDRRSNSLAMKWIIQAARDKKGKPMEEKLFAEIMDAYKNEVSIHISFPFNLYIYIYIYSCKINHITYSVCCSFFCLRAYSSCV